MSYILAIDQGTTSSRAILFDSDLKPVSTGQKEFRQIFPKDGWVEHDPEEIWKTTVETCKQALTKEASAIGITNQRETLVIWDKTTGKPEAEADGPTVSIRTFRGSQSGRIDFDK